ncbi:MAG: hypothetical protein A3C93_02610 [Candidatus Lloydbacteria bacterium RIFCSPHIGHO2_02_FULL_54_17]|uniref:DUF4276 family protein n=1 Tax=Candidatus Lloydbacteria bacterium RIFCSPHIGHO2_02_FULL_54_17 TaxID=1798664 RepID=A0A1G2DG11_9BACT|nr:MAG: hypothetical protein A2762_04290 [Candidatus Lloydbacteria bacterium RIFCSPHIGHO2_01_FULL_54_11]OGZ11800.1 MAG: hypothetical protein A3C93_02610 [Candidatus Lloydbacteria bacterium RIFCSPHIGHO2_02_FULL_54_17]OGZ14329.1 MAG: hypothetical protein A2948_01945 [Candidatus Lloydbacteria bacterium RIFCSPLOWO2_01_FULL_54_18]OGZ16002.1 MAG: hypothetical protein A3H76_00535 [Candidatus Lloydbacteria bacterium RIFCSPLOWO2_02_FULL_54_12]
MTNLCVLIGEGPSERHFLPSLLQSKLGFLPLEEKSPHLFQKGEGLFWFFPFPPLATNPEGGKARLRRTETYRMANAVIENKKYIYGDAEVHYRVIVDHIFTDKVGQQTKKEEIEAALRSSGVPFAGCRVDVVENEIECWYFAGLNEHFPYLNRSENAAFKRLLGEEPERISDSKGNIKTILSPDVHGAIKMAEVMGRHFDIEKARTKSPSFNAFIASLETDRLI